MGSFDPFFEEDLIISAEALEKVGRLMLSYIQRQSNELRLDAKGKPFPQGVDLYESGNLLHKQVEVKVDAVKGLVDLIFNAPYADEVASRFDFVGICPQLLPQFLEEAEAIIVAGITSA